MEHVLCTDTRPFDCVNFQSTKDDGHELCTEGSGSLQNLSCSVPVNDLRDH